MLSNFNPSSSAQSTRAAAPTGRTRVSLHALCRLCFCLALPSHALVSPLRIEFVPTETILKNLEEKVEASPKSGTVRAQFARTLSLAYVQRLPRSRGLMVPVETHAYSRQQVHLRALHEFELQKRSGTTSAAAKQYLTNAIGQYKIAISLGGSNVFNYLGLGWCLKEQAETNAALQYLRTALELSKTFEQSKPSGVDIRYFSDLDLTQEICHYLISLLDRSKDAAEIAKLKKLQRDHEPRKSNDGWRPTFDVLLGPAGADSVRFSMIGFSDEDR